MEDILDVEKLVKLYQRRYSYILDIKNITDELSEALSGQDGTTAEIILDERMSAIERVEDSWQKICEMGEIGPKSAFEARRLIFCEPDEIEPENEDEKAVKHIRLKTQVLIKELQEQDKFLNKRLAREESYYKD
ncbi:hypothetical protein UYO_1848 [Lachnospiraceae bacterium JC7]|nr:hypothetical protein UYO_1848 [Lachnospiraceae bacterium JC7]